MHTYSIAQTTHLIILQYVLRLWTYYRNKLSTNTHTHKNILDALKKMTYMNKMLFFFFFVLNIILAYINLMGYEYVIYILVNTVFRLKSHFILILIIIVIIKKVCYNILNNVFTKSCYTFIDKTEETFIVLAVSLIY